MPMGFEYGCRKRLDPVRTSSEQWIEETRTPRVDLTEFIAATDELKGRTEALTVAGPLRRVSAPNGRVVALLRMNAGSPLASTSAALTLINPDQGRPDGIDLGPLLTATGGRIERFTDVTPAVPRFPSLPARSLHSSRWRCASSRVMYPSKE